MEGHHHISTEELRRAIRKADKDATKRKKNKWKKANQQAEKMGKTNSSEEEEAERKASDETDCIVFSPN